MKPNTVVYLFPDGSCVSFDRIAEPVRMADGHITRWTVTSSRIGRPHYQYKVSVRPSETQAIRLLKEADDLYKRQYPDAAGERIE